VAYFLGHPVYAKTEPQIGRVCNNVFIDSVPEDLSYYDLW